jgi:hypothetical protein
MQAGGVLKTADILASAPLKIRNTRKSNPPCHTVRTSKRGRRCNVYGQPSLGNDSGTGNGTKRAYRIVR